jgi:putative hemolysin
LIYIGYIGVLRIDYNHRDLYKRGFITMNFHNRAALMMLTITMSACASQENVEQPKRVGLANPASTYCISLGGKRETRTDAAGNESSACHLPDGSIIDEWALFRRDHRQP